MIENKNTKDILKKIFFWWLNIIFLEGTFALTISNNMNLQWEINIILSSFILAQILCLIGSIGNEKINKILTFFFLLIMGVLFATQAVFYKIFKVYFSLYDLTLQDQLNSFMKETIGFIIRYFGYIVLFMIPFIAFFFYHKKINTKRISWKSSLVLLFSIVMSICIRSSLIDFNKDKIHSTYDLIHNVNSISLNIKKLGVINSYYLEGKRIIFGFNPKTIQAVSIEKEEKEEEEVIVYEPNQLELNLSDTENATINTINAYMREEKPTLRNEYTGMFKGYNLIYITAESFSEIGVREDLTPTLYKLTHSGFVFHNFYTPNNLSTIGGEFQSLTGLYPDYSILSKWRSGTNAFPYGLANTFIRLGYTTNAYHNNSYVFQDRNQYLASQGFTNFLACYNGLERRMNCGRWPQSDDEMIEVTQDDYIHNEGPFLAYYMTVSGHFAYDYNGNSIAVKNRDLVINLPYSEAAQAYLATQIELDRALERLINSLEAENKLDKTVIVLMADHYPYELNMNAVNELSSYERDSVEVNHNALIIWNSEMDTVEIDKPCMSSDVIPTVYNLFGISYDSRLFTGKDILSDDFGIAILSDRSWISDKGRYNASTGEFYAKEEVKEDYVDNVNQLVNNRLNISRLILESNYYNYLFR